MISTSPDFTENIYDNANITDNQISPGIENELPDNLYYWKVRVENEVYQGDWSDVWCFRVDTLPPAAPTLVSPANGENLKDNTPTLIWQNVNENSLPVVYIIQVDNENTFAGALQITIDNWQTSGNSYCTLPELEDNLYYWRVRARDNAGNENENAWSNVWTFRVDTLPPASPHLRSPGSGAGVNTLAPTLVWDSVAEVSLPVLYQVEVDTSSSFNTTNKKSSEWISSTSWQTPSLSEGTWYWRVKAKDNAGNEGGWSSSQSFIVDVNPPSTPTISCSTHPSATPTSSPSPVFSWNAVGGPSPVGYQYKLEGYDTDWRATTGTSVSYANVPDGRYTFKLKATDTGGTSGTAEYVIIIDTTPSSVTLTGITATETATGWTLETDLSPFVLRGTVEPGSRVTVNGLPVSVAGDGSFSATYDLSAGQNRFVIRVMDPAGNVTERTLLVYYSGGAPPAAVTGPAPVSGSTLFLVAVVVLIVVLVGVILKFR